MAGRALASTLVAGEPEFVARMRPALQRWAGGEPALALEPRQATAAFSQPGGLLVLQYAGRDWLPVVGDLRARWGDRVVLVVAMARDRAAEVATVRAAGADAVAPWDGDPDAVLAVVERVLAARAGAAHRPPSAGPGPTDAREVIRRAGALRFRVGQALAAAPGTPLDPPSVQALLAEIDGVLGELTAVLAAVPPQARTAIEAVRSGLVGEAIELTEALQRPAAGAPRSPEAPSPAAAAAPAAPTEAPVEARAAVAGAAEDRGRRSRVRLLVALGIAALAAGAFHLHGAATRAPPPEPPAFAGAPRNAVAVRDRAVGIVVSQPGKAIDARDVERFRAEEALRGNAVKEVAPGVYVSVPAGAREGARP